MAYEKFQSTVASQALIPTTPSTSVHFEQQIRKVGEARACRYLASFPGPDDQPDNKKLHDNLHTLVNGEDIETSLISILHQLNRRQGVMKLATQIKDMLGLDCPDCEDFDIAENQEHDGFRHLVRYHGLFDAGSWSKGRDYLAVVMKQAGWTQRRANGKLERVKKKLRKSLQTHGTSTRRD